MDVAQRIVEIEEAWHDDDPDLGQLLASLADDVASLPPWREPAPPRRSSHTCPWKITIWRHVGLVAGAVLETGLDAAPLARAVMEPVVALRGGGVPARAVGSITLRRRKNS